MRLPVKIKQLIEGSETLLIEDERLLAIGSFSSPRRLDQPLAVCV